MSESPFRFHGGRPSLDLVATVGKRYTAPFERLTDEGLAARWLVEAGVLPAEANGSVGTAQLARMRNLRENVHELVAAAITGAPMPRSGLRGVNREAVGAPLGAVLDGIGRSHIAWQGDPVDAAIASVARDAVDLLARGKIHRIKRCEGNECSLLFYDDSQAGRRRWCSMTSCGNRSKVRAYRTRETGR